MATRLSSLETKLEIIGGTSESLSPDVFEGIARYRHKVFVESLGWELPTHGGLELDQFDRVDTIYMAAREEDGRLVGTARLLPTDRPYLLGEVFPQLTGEAPPPRRADIWELSRFAAIDLNKTTGPQMSQFSSPIATSLLFEALQLAAAHSVKQLITVSPLGVERLLRRAGFAAHRYGPPVIVGGQSLIACCIKVQGTVPSRGEDVQYCTCWQRPCENTL